MMWAKRSKVPGICHASVNDRASVICPTGYPALAIGRHKGGGLGREEEPQRERLETREGSGSCKRCRQVYRQGSTSQGLCEPVKETNNKQENKLVKIISGYKGCKKKPISVM